MHGVWNMCWRWRSPLVRLHLSTRQRMRVLARTIVNDSIEYDPRVTLALSRDTAIVALESTIITHGMPYPQNLRTAEQVEHIVTENGATPATIALMKGKVRIGLEQCHLEELAKHDGAVKASRRDIAWVLSKGLCGGTTVSGTMIAAQAAGIHVFVTGGIGGVHRGGQTSLDVSADLTELGRTPVAVISAGIKSILDIPRTLEYLETQGVTVATYGESKDFPAFFTPSSGYQAPINVTCAREAAELIDYNLSLELGSGILIGVPIPASLAAEGEVIEQAIQTALQQASDEGVSGKEVTPFILQRVNEITKGQSLQANIALIKNNAAVGSKIAVELSHIKNQRSKIRRDKRPTATGASPATDDPRRPVVIGGSNVDLVSSITNHEIIYGDGTNPGRVHITLGGVGRNIADCLSRLGASPLFVSAIGCDSQGNTLLNQSSHMDTSGIAILDGHNTATYSCVIDYEGSMVVGVGDMDISNQITPKYVSQFEEHLRCSPLVCVDGNVPTDTIEYVCQYCSKYNVPVWFEPTCVSKATKPFLSNWWKTLSYISPNFGELCMMYNSLDKNNADTFKDTGTLTLNEKIELCMKMTQQLLHHIYCVIVTLGQDGVLVCRNADLQQPFLVGSSNMESSSTTMSAIHYPACIADQITSVSGAGDCLAGAMIAGILRQASPHKCVQSGMTAAMYSTQSYLPVPPSITTIDASHCMMSTQQPRVIS